MVFVENNGSWWKDACVKKTIFIEGRVGMIGTRIECAVISGTYSIYPPSVYDFSDNSDTNISSIYCLSNLFYFIFIVTTCRKLNSLESCHRFVWRHFDETFGNFAQYVWQSHCCCHIGG
jgi:hypothetical protein